MTPITKKDIASSFREIETKFGGICFNFGDKRRGRTATVGKSDLEIVYKGLLCMIEIKVGTDKLTEKQINYGLAVCDVPTVPYVIADENTYQLFKELILRGDRMALNRYKGECKLYLLKEQKRLQDLEAKRNLTKK